MTSSEVASPKKDSGSDKGGSDDEYSADDEDDVGRHNDGSSRIGLLQKCSTKRLGDLVWLIVGMIGECDRRRLTIGVVVSGIGVECLERSSNDEEWEVGDLIAIMELDLRSRECDRVGEKAG